MHPSEVFRLDPKEDSQELTRHCAIARPGSDAFQEADFRGGWAAWRGSGVSKPQAAFWTGLSTLVTELLGSSCAPWVMSPIGQSNLLLIRRLLHPSTSDFGPIRGQFFAQVLPKLLMPASFRWKGLLNES